MRKILGVNGIRTDGANSTDLILSRLKNLGCSVRDVKHPKVSLFDVPFLRFDYLKRRDAGIIITCMEQGDNLIAHSYGCLRSLEAMERGAKFNTVFWFAPAMDADFEIPVGGCKRLFIIYNKYDKAIWWAKLLLLHDFGKMGRVGYQGPPDPRVVNVEDTSISDKKAWNHSHYFNEYHLDKWVQFVYSKLSPSEQQ